MFKVLLVDDEILTREAISRNIPWEDQGFYLVGAAENGQDAIGYIEKERPDLVITDICMPYMDGLELASYVYQKHPDTKVVILSGHDEFEYARHALEYRVKEYIVKPVTSLELKEVLKRVKLSLEEDARQKAHIERIQAEYEKNIPVLRERFLRKLLEEKYSKQDVFEQMRNLGIQLQGQYYAVALLDLEDASEFCMIYPDQEQDLVDFTIGNIANEIMEGNKQGIMVHLSEQKTALLFAADGEEELLGEVKRACDRILQALWDFVKIKVSVVVGETVREPYGWRDSCQSAKEALEYKFLSEKKDYIHGTDLKERKHINGHIPVHHWSDKLSLCIKLNRKEELEQEIEALFSDILENCCLKKDIILYIQNTLLSIIVAVESNERAEKEYLEERSMMKKLPDNKYLEDVKSAFINICFSIMDKVAGQKEGEGRRQSVLAMDYIEKNYMDPNMSLSMVCSYLGVSISYFSVIFKNHTGETFVEALTRIRIEKSKKLMDTTDYRAYEIAERVGYKDPHYFSLIFKKVTGMTPSEYAKSGR
ncbi:MAG TPA: response regulator [Clostridiales bacterium]|nr:response regulator [Clostridiales bacterium]